MEAEIKQPLSKTDLLRFIDSVMMALRAHSLELWWIGAAVDEPASSGLQEAAHAIRRALMHLERGRKAALESDLTSEEMAWAMRVTAEVLADGAQFLAEAICKHVDGGGKAAATPAADSPPSISSLRPVRTAGVES